MYQTARILDSDDLYIRLNTVVRLMNLLDPKPNNVFNKDATSLYKKLDKLALELVDKCLEEVNPKTTSRQPTHSS